MVSTCADALNILIAEHLLAPDMCILYFNNVNWWYYFMKKTNVVLSITRCGVYLFPENRGAAAAPCARGPTEESHPLLWPGFHR
jgi:hypothetical protein